MTQTSQEKRAQADSEKDHGGYGREALQYPVPGSLFAVREKFPETG
jgi:hypothetical protein